MHAAVGRERNLSESQLGAYQVKWHLVAVWVLRNTMAQVTLREADERTKAALDTVAELLHVGESRRAFAGEDAPPGRPL